MTPRTLIAAALCWTLAGPARGADIDLARDPGFLPGPFFGVVERIIDPDTYEVRFRQWLHQDVTVHFRLGGVNAPEKGSRCPEERDAFARSLDRAKQLLGGGDWTEAGKGRHVSWKPVGDRWVSARDISEDTYPRRVDGRLLNEAGQDIAATLLSEGLVRPYAGTSARPTWCPPTPAKRPEGSPP